MKSIFLFFLVLLFFVACGDPPQEPAEEAEEQSLTEDSAILPQIKAPIALATTPPPPKPGCYEFSRDEFITIVNGDPGDVHPTNAERGFGFLRPHGVLLQSNQPQLVILSGSLELSTLRLTRFDPDALLPESWWQDTEPGRAGWLPAVKVPITVERDPDNPNLLRLRPNAPLAPGFYVLHDGSLIRGQSKSELNAFFPFQISSLTDQPAATRWLDDADQCVKEIEAALINKHAVEIVDGLAYARFDHRTFQESQRGHLRRCAERLVALKGAVTADEDRQLLNDSIHILQAIANPATPEELSYLRALAVSKHPHAPLLYYWLELTALHLIEEVRSGLANDTLSDNLSHTAALVAFYDSLPNSERHSAALQHLLWVPFFLDPQWQQLEDLSGRLSTDLDAYELLLTLLSAHRLQRLEAFAQAFPSSPLSPTVAAYLRTAPADLKRAQSTLDTSRATNTSLIIGEPFFDYASNPSSLDPKVLAELVKWVNGRKRAIHHCLEKTRRQPPPKRLVLIDIDFDNTFFGQNTKALVRGPNRPSDTPAIVAPTIASCIQDEALASIPTIELGGKLKLTFPVAFVGKSLDFSSIR